jgi:hypothetical protein
MYYEVQYEIIVSVFLFEISLRTACTSVDTHILNCLD